MSPSVRAKTRADTSILDKLTPNLDRPRPWYARPRVFIPVLVVLVGLTAIGIVGLQRDSTTATQEKTDTQVQLGTVSDPLNELCKTDASVRARVGDQVCGLAAAVVANPEIPTPGPQGLPGEQGSAGAAGRGIVATSITNGDLVIRYSDGSSETVGRVLGADGATGPSGVSITGSAITNGRLVLTFSDGTARDVGAVVGAPGPQGVPGADGATGSPGRGVAGVDVVNDRIVVSYTDDTSEDIGPLPTGPAGPAGTPGRDGSPAEALTLRGAGPLGGDLACTRDPESPATSPTYSCS